MVILFLQKYGVELEIYIVNGIFLSFVCYAMVLHQMIYARRLMVHAVMIKQVVMKVGTPVGLQQIPLVAEVLDCLLFLEAYPNKKILLQMK